MQILIKQFNKKRSKIINQLKKIEFFKGGPGVKKLENFIRITTGPKREMSKLVKLLKALLINF